MINKKPVSNNAKNKTWKDDPFAKDWTRGCQNCDQKPVVNMTGLCGPCTWGESDTINGNW